MTNAITKGSFGAYQRPDRLESLLALGLAATLAIYLPILLHRVTDGGYGDAQVFFRAAWAVWTGYPL